MKMADYLKNRSKGFTLVEIMVAVAILGGMSVALLNLTKQSTKTVTKFQSDSDADYIWREIAGDLSDPTICTPIFAGKSSVSDNTVTTIGKFIAGTTKYGTNNLMIDSFQVSNSGVPVGDQPTDTNLRIVFTNPNLLRKFAGDTTMKPRLIPLKITRTGTNITTCVSAMNNQNDLWTLHANNTDVFRATGRVGILTNAPRIALDVGGEIVAQNRVTLSNDATITSPTWSIDNQADRFRIFRQPNLVTVGTEFMTVLNSGNVGVGTAAPAYRLDINGTSRSATHLIVSGATNVGQIWYGGGAFKLEALGGGVPLQLAANGAVHAAITTAGNFGIGTVGPTEKLHVVGNILATGSMTVSSDKRLKQNIKPIQDALTKIDSLRGVQYYWIDPDKHEAGEQIGFIAQEVEKVFPQVVRTSSEGTKSVSYMALVAPVVNALKELHKKLLGLESKVLSLFEKIDEKIDSLDSKKADQSELEKIKQENAYFKAENALIKSYLCQKDLSAPFCKKIKK